MLARFNLGLVPLRPDQKLAHVTISASSYEALVRHLGRIHV